MIDLKSIPTVKRSPLDLTKSSVKENRNLGRTMMPRQTSRSDLRKQPILSKESYKIKGYNLRSDLVPAQKINLYQE